MPANVIYSSRTPLKEMRGLNIVVYDCKNDKVVETVVFDSYENTDVRSYQ